MDNSAALGMGMGLMNPGMLMIENTAAYGGGYGAPSYGAPGGIPDPYSKDNMYGGYGAAPSYGGGYGGGGYY